MLSHPSLFLTKFPSSFVQEFVGTPADGISHLLEVLRAIQMAQASNQSGLELELREGYVELRHT